MSKEGQQQMNRNLYNKMDESDDVIRNMLALHGDEPLGEYTFNFPDSLAIFGQSSVHDFTLTHNTSDSLHTPQRPVAQDHEIKSEVTSTGSPPMFHPGPFLNLAQFEEAPPEPPTENIVSPLYGITIQPWAGFYNFKVNIPKPNLDGVKPKWCYSTITHKMYVAKNVAFPLNISMNAYITGATLVVIPVFTKSSNRISPVTRCPNCLLSDRNEEVKNHVLQIEGSSPTYFMEGNRPVASIRLGAPAPGDDSVPIFIKVACNTSCVGGPNRRPFMALLSLRVQDREIGRQCINIKCCEGPVRDMGKEEKKELCNNNTNNLGVESVRQLASEIGKSTKQKKEKEKKEKTLNSPEAEQQFESLKIPKIYAKKVKKYVNFLHMKEQMKNQKLKRYYSTEPDSD